VPTAAEAQVWVPWGGKGGKEGGREGGEGGVVIDFGGVKIWVL